MEQGLKFRLIFVESSNVKIKFTDVDLMNLLLLSRLKFLLGRHLKLVDWPCWFQEPSQYLKRGECASPAYIFTYINEINDVFFHIHKIKQNIFYEIFCKNKSLMTR